MDMEQNLLEISKLSLSIKQADSTVTILQDIDFEIRKGEVLGLVGPSGSGKSMTAKAILRLWNHPENYIISGQAIWCDTASCTDLFALNSKEIQKVRGAKIGMIYQDPINTLDPSKRIETQIIDLLKIDAPKASKKELKIRVIELLGRVALVDPERIARAYPHEVSGGQAQRIGIAMALARDPALLIADEPISSLDKLVQKEIILLFQKLNKEGLSILFISHNQAIVDELCDRQVFISEGKIVSDSVKYQPKGNIKERSLELGVILFEISNLSKCFTQHKNFLGLGKSKKIRALDQVSFNIHQNECLGIIGESGSGKSTLARILANIEDEYTGDVKYQGTSLKTQTIDDKAVFKKEVQIVFQNPFAAVNPRLSIRQIILDPLRNSGFTMDKKKELLIDVMKLMNLSESYLDRLAHQISGGECQRVCLARALITQPKFLILDECVSSLDYEIKMEILDLLFSLKQKQNIGMVFISHDIETVRKLADRVMILKEGRIEELGNIIDVFNKPKSLYTADLIS